MEHIELKAEPRISKSKSNAKVLRRQGKIPGVVYGNNYEALPVQFEERILNRVIKKAGTHSLISLQVDGKKPQMTIVRDVQRDVVKHNLLHIDLYAVQMDVKINSKVPIIFVGESPCVINDGGVLTQNMDEIEIECLPGNLPDSVEVNIDGLVAFGDGINVSDLDLGDDITLLIDPEALIIKVEPPRKQEEEEELETDLEEVGAEPEVITAAKEE